MRISRELTTLLDSSVAKAPDASRMVAEAMIFILCRLNQIFEMVKKVSRD